MTVRVEIRREPEVISRLEPLWHALREHQGALPGVPRLQDAATSWSIERTAYLEALRHPDAFVVTAVDESQTLVGYAFVKVRSGRDEMWDTRDRIGDLETLSVSPGHRGSGIGSLIMDAVLAELARKGIADFQLGVLAANQSAMRFYARYSLTPRLVILSNFR